MTIAIPNITARPLDANGNWSQTWYRYLGSITQGVNAENTGANPAPVVLTGSPFVFRAPGNGSLIVQGGGISAMAFSRDGLAWVPLGTFYGMFPLSAGDQIRVSYPGAAPTLTFVLR